jgi:hypothetical protein
MIPKPEENPDETHARHRTPQRKDSGKGTDSGESTAQETANTP